MTAFTPEQEARIREIVAEEKRAGFLRAVPCDKSFGEALRSITEKDSYAVGQPVEGCRVMDQDGMNLRIRCLELAVNSRPFSPDLIEAPSGVDIRFSPYDVIKEAQRFYDFVAATPSLANEEMVGD